MKPKTTANNHRSLGRKGWALIVLTAIVVIVFGVFLANDLPVRARYSATVNELEKIKKDVMEPAGAVQQSGEEKRGDGLLDSIFNCGPDVQCPTVGAVWFVPVEKGKEQDFTRALLQKEGYTVTAGDKNPCSLEKTSTCGVSGEKGDFDVSVNIETASDARPTPSADVSPKLWRIVSLRITN
jgi:hypothetical protein